MNLIEAVLIEKLDETLQEGPLRTSVKAAGAVAGGFAALKGARMAGKKIGDMRAAKAAKNAAPEELRIPSGLLPKWYGNNPNPTDKFKLVHHLMGLQGKYSHGNLPSVDELLNHVRSHPNVTILHTAAGSNLDPAAKTVALLKLIHRNMNRK